LSIAPHGANQLCRHAVEGRLRSDHYETGMISFSSNGARLAADVTAGAESRARFVKTLAIALVAVAASSLLGGCAILHDVGEWFRRERTPPPAVASPVEVPPPPPPVQLPKPKPVQHEAARPEKPDKPEKPERLAEVDPNTLIGLDPPTVEKVLGAPSKVSKSDISLVWTYSAPNCSFQVFFYPDLKTSAFHALKYGGIDGNGAQLAMSELCIRGILTAKTNAPG
jgi:hypothetical protein